MKIFSIVQEEVKRSFRKIGILFIMTLLPISLILILGLVFDNDLGDSGVMFSDMIVYHMTIGEKGELTDNIELMMNEVLINDTSVYVETHDQEEALNLLENAKITCFLIINELDSEIQIYKNSLYNMESSMIEGVLSTFVSRYNAITEIIKVNPMAMAEISEDIGEYTKTRSLDKTKSPNAMAYYGIVEVTLFVLYGVMTPFYGVTFDRQSGMSDRILSAPVKKRDYFLGKFIGSVVITSIQMGIVIFFSSQVLGSSWGDRPLLPIFLIFTEILAITSLGVSFGLSSKNENAATPVIHLLIAVSGFFGGAYATLYDMGALGEVGKYFSILWWNNTGIMNYVYLNDFSAFSIAFIINISLAVVFFLIAVYRMNNLENYKNA